MAITPGVHAVTGNTPERILFGAGTIHKNLAYTAGSGTAGSWNFADSCVGATSGGSKFAITPEVTPVEVDGAMVRMKGFDVKTGETATMEINFIELSKELIKAATLGDDGTSADTNYDLIESKSAIEDGDYWDNIAFVGQTLNGDKIIVIMENALCTSGFNPDAQNKSAAVPYVTFVCHADPDVSVDKLPWKIYYPAST